MARWALTVRRVRFLAVSYARRCSCQHPALPVRSQGLAVPATCKAVGRVGAMFGGSFAWSGVQALACRGRFRSYLSDTLAVLAAVQDSPGDAARVLALEEKGLGFAVLEAEDLGVSTDVELTLQPPKTVSTSWTNVSRTLEPARRSPFATSSVQRPETAASCISVSCRSFLLLPSIAIWHCSPKEIIIVPCQGRSSGPRKCRRTSSF